jgi:microcystin-dependent protein
MPLKQIQLITNRTAIFTNTAKIGVPTGENGDLLTNDGTNWVAKKSSIQAHEFQTINVRNPYIGIHYIIALEGIYPSRNSSDPFLAEIIIFGGNFEPRGWAFCDGQILSISQNTALFSLLGITYGGDGRTTFGLPDLRGRTPVHAGNGAGLSNVRLGQTGGSESITIPAQTHVITYE